MSSRGKNVLIQRGILDTMEAADWWEQGWLFIQACTNMDRAYALEIAML